jgi:hypothetical protein
MNKYLLYLKKPKILGIILLFIVVIIAIVSIIISLNSKTSPPPPKPPPCPGKQANYCPDGIQCSECRVDQKWDCTSKACVCKNIGFKSCNGNSECCSTCYTDDMCCTGSTQGTTFDPKTKTYKKICCPPDTTPGPTGEGCLSSNCGRSTKPCDQGQTCMKITGLTGSDFTQAVNYTKKDNTYRDDDGSTLYLCANPPSCSFISESAEYRPFHSDAASFYYNTDNIMKDGDNICIPIDSTQYGSTGSPCYSPDQQLKCDNILCEKKSSFDIFRGAGGSQDLGQHMKIIMGLQDKSEYGYYCAGGNGSDPFLQYESIIANVADKCTWHDCQRELEEPGIIRMQWDEDSKKCSALKSNSGVGVRGAVKCNGPGDPCSDCNSSTDYANCVLCTGTGTPCLSCPTAGTYISDSSCERGLWKFTDCRKDNDMVLNSSAPGESCNQDSAICGNCPWGGNDPSLIDDFGPIENGLQSGSMNELGYVCVSDSQIRVSNVTPTKRCSDTYVRNNDKTACVYACRKDGDDARKYPDNSTESTDRQYFTAKKIGDQIYCFRNPLDFSYMQDGCVINYFTGACYHPDPPSGSSDSFVDQIKKANYDWTGQCDYLRKGDFFHHLDNDCFVTMKDTLPDIPNYNIPDLPIYLYPKNIKPWHANDNSPSDNEPVNCWTRTRPDNFYYSTNTLTTGSPPFGAGPFITHPQIDKMDPSEFCSPI